MKSVSQKKRKYTCLSRLPLFRPEKAISNSSAQDFAKKFVLEREKTDFKINEKPRPSLQKIRIPLSFEVAAQLASVQIAT